jgi:hypothetical protein
MNPPAKLSGTQFAILSEASQRKDRSLIPPKTVKATARQKVAAKLLTAGLVREIKAKTCRADGYANDLCRWWFCETPAPNI